MEIYNCPRCGHAPQYIGVRGQHAYQCASCRLGTRIWKTAKAAALNWNTIVEDLTPQLSFDFSGID